MWGRGARAQDSDLAHRGERYEDLGCSDRTLFRERSAADVYASYDILAAAAGRVDEGRLSRSSYAQMEKAMGMNRNPHGLLADHALRPVIDPVATMTWDWVHSYLQDGVFTTEVSEMIRACGPYGVSFEHLRRYLKDDAWRFPAASKAKSSALHRVFDSWRSTVADPNQARPIKLGTQSSCSDERFLRWQVVRRCRRHRIFGLVWHEFIASKHGVVFQTCA